MLAEAASFPHRGKRDDLAGRVAEGHPSRVLWLHAYHLIPSSFTVRDKPTTPTTPTEEKKKEKTQITNMLVL